MVSWHRRIGRDIRCAIPPPCSWRPTVKQDDLDGVERLLTEALARVQALRAARFPASGAGPLKRHDGRLTELGVAKLRALALAGMSNSQIAKEMQITHAAAARQCEKLKAS